MTEFWRRAVPPEATTSEVDFIENRLGLTPRSRVLDVPCGSGSTPLALAAGGHDVLGVDISTEAIDHARRAAADTGLDVELVVAEMREIPRDGSFDAAVCMGNSFGYLDPDGLGEFVAAYDVAGSGLLSSYVFTRGTQEVKVTALHHVYTVAHLRRLRVDGGFTDIEQCGGPDGEPFEVGTGRLLLTAHRA